MRACGWRSHESCEKKGPTHATLLTVAAATPRAVAPRRLRTSTTSCRLGGEESARRRAASARAMGRAARRLIPSEASSVERRSASRAESARTEAKDRRLGASNEGSAERAMPSNVAKALALLEVYGGSCRANRGAKGQSVINASSAMSAARRAQCSAQSALCLPMPTRRPPDPFAYRAW